MRVNFRLRWNKFLNIVEKAKKACEGSGQVILDGAVALSN